MKNNQKNWEKLIHDPVRIPAEDFPDIELYMDQITTFMNTRLEKTRRYPEDKILTKTMINNYTKNHLLPPSVRKKYAKEHLFMLIFIYHLKHMLSINDIQAMLNPLSDRFFSPEDESSLTLQEIYDKTVSLCGERHPDILNDIRDVYEKTKDLFTDHDLSEDDAAYLELFSFIYQLCYDIFVRKQLIEKMIDSYRERNGKP